MNGKDGESKLRGGKVEWIITKFPLLLSAKIIEIGYVYVA